MNIEKILLITFALINLSALVSKSVMAKVGENDGKNCPDLMGPAFACGIYFITLLFLIFLTVKTRSGGHLNNFNFGLLCLIIIIVLAVTISYVPFIYHIQNKKPTDTECLDKNNKKAIEYLEILINASLVLFSFIIFFSFSAN